MRVGVGLPVSGGWATPEAMVRVATRAEELGYDSVWSFQRLLHPVDEDWGAVYHAVHDPVTSLAFVAGRTTRVRLGIAVVNLPFYAPIVLAKALTTLDVVSGGRLDVGLGLGWAPQEFEAAGVPMDRRGARGEEFVRALRAIWTAPEEGFRGEFYRLPAARVEPRPVQRPHPPVLLGGSVDVALDRAGRIADGWISSSRTDLTTIGASIDRIRAAAERAGRDASTLRFVVRGVVRLGEPAGGGRRPLQGSVEQIRADLEALGAQGVTEVFLDLNWDPRFGADDADPAAALALAEEQLAALAPAGG